MEHFIKPSYGKIWHFCHNSEGICYSSVLGEQNTNYEVLVADGEPDFDVIIDNNDNIHLVCQNQNGDILYMTYDKEKWSTQVLMKSKSKENYPKNFSLQRVGNWINILYSLEYKNNRIVAHQIVGNDGETPRVLDYIDGDFSVAKDKFNNIFVLFQSHTYQNFGYMVYIWSKKEWSDFVAIPVEGTVTKPHIFVDKSNTVHVTGVLNDEIIYFSDAVQVFGKGDNPIFIEKGNLYLLWESEQDGKIHAACSADGGKTFSTTTEFMAGRFSSARIYAIAYTSYEESCRASKCYGYLSEGTVKFYLSPDFFNISRVPPRPLENNIEREAQDFRQQLLPTNTESDFKRILIEIEKLSIKLDILQKTLDTKAQQ